MLARPMVPAQPPSGVSYLIREGLFFFAICREYGAPMALLTWDVVGRVLMRLGVVGWLDCSAYCLAYA